MPYWIASRKTNAIWSTDWTDSMLLARINWIHFEACLVTRRNRLDSIRQDIDKVEKIYDMATRKELTSYFPHDSNARNSDKLIRLRMRHKAAGYGVYFMILERLREEPEYTSVKDYNMIAFDLREDTSLIKSVVEDFGLFVFTDDGKYFYSESFKQRMEIKDEQSRKKAEAGKKGLEKRWGNSKNIANAIENDSKAIANATGNDSNKRKEKESKEKESKEKYPPPLSPTGGNGGCGNIFFLKIPIQMG